MTRALLVITLAAAITLGFILWAIYGATAVYVVRHLLEETER